MRQWESRIVPRHLQFVIRNDEELSKLLSALIISYRSVKLYFQAVLLPEKNENRPFQDDKTLIKEQFWNFLSSIDANYLQEFSNQFRI